jgi:hypothetical protein
MAATLDFVKKMKTPDVITWVTVLGAARLHVCIYLFYNLKKFTYSRFQNVA